MGREQITAAVRSGHHLHRSCPKIAGRLCSALAAAIIAFSLHPAISSAAPGDDYQQLATQSQRARTSAAQTIQERVRKEGTNAPTPEFGEIVEKLKAKLTQDPTIQARIKTDRALQALYNQTLNHLQHVSFSFEMRDAGYPHGYALKGPYPFRPTQLALEKTEEFFKIVSTSGTPGVTQIPKNPALEKQLMDEQKELIKKITNDSFGTYDNMRNRLKSGGPNASFPEFRAVVDYLELKLQSDDVVAKLARENPQVATFRKLTLDRLAQVKGSSLPYRSTVDAIQRSLEFYDVFYRAIDPKRSPALYHSGRYEYYTHFLEAAVPDHIMLPTPTSLGATDILKSRGVPIGLLGVNTDITWVDGYYQTPYEFYVHDVNHTRRMYQFLEEDAAAKGISVEQYARQSDEFVKKKIMPLISVNKADDEITKNKKRLRKILLFEILHEDALPAAPDVIERAILRPPKQLTPFEAIVGGKKVSYVMEPGATTLAYVYRKLAHDFYDMPGERIDNIVAPSFRTRENIVEAAETVFKTLGLPVDNQRFQHFVSTDAGFPEDFRNTLVRDIATRPNETVPLNDNPAHTTRTAPAVSAPRAATPQDATPEQIAQYFKSRNKKVVTFIGYSGAEYQDPQRMLSEARAILSKHDPKTTIINIGATPEGIGKVYELAQQMGFETTGIVSSQARKYGGLSPHVNQAFYVEDATWGGFVPGTNRLSPTSHAMINVSDEVVGIGGGEVGRDEMIAARRAGKKVQFLSADMNHDLAIQKALKKGAPRPTDFSGAVEAAMNLPVKSPQEIQQFFRSKGKNVVTFIGYSGAEYEHPEKMLSEARAILSKYDPMTTVVNIGATPEGVGKVYELAKEMGFETTGIVSSQAKKYGGLSPFVDHAFFVEDSSWGGFIPGTNRLSPTSQAMVGVSDNIIGIGAGEVGRDEMIAARRAGKQVQFVPADMNHQLAVQKAAKKGAAPPNDFRGAAHTGIVPEVKTEAEIAEYFRSRGKKVVTFLGYSGAEYQDKQKMLQQARRILERLDPKTTIINIGATPEGVGSVYQLAKGMGFETTGIVSVQAQKYGQASPFVDRAFYVQDDSWGGFKPGTEELSPTSRAMIQNSDQVISIGGGEVARDELTAARRMGKPTSFFPAEMNHQLAIQKATKKGLPAPTEFRGAAHTPWNNPTTPRTRGDATQCLMNALQVLLNQR
jgi:hypothetical protein